MRQQRSPSTGRRYPLTMICEIYRRARSTVYAAGSATAPAERGKRGPRTAVTDAEVVAEIRAGLAACPFHGEGYRKGRARLAPRGYGGRGQRVLRPRRGHGLAGPPR